MAFKLWVTDTNVASKTDGASPFDNGFTANNVASANQVNTALRQSSLITLAIIESLNIDHTNLSYSSLYNDVKTAITVAINSLVTPTLSNDGNNLKITINSISSSIKVGYADKAEKDENGNNIVNTYATKTSVNNEVSRIDGNITDIQGDITNIQGDITNLQGDVSGLKDIRNKHYILTTPTPLQLYNTINASDGSFKVNYIEFNGNNQSKSFLRIATKYVSGGSSSTFDTESIYLQNNTSYRFNYDRKEGDTYYFKSDNFELVVSKISSQYAIAINYLPKVKSVEDTTTGNVTSYTVTTLQGGNIITYTNTLGFNVRVYKANSISAS